MPFSSANRKFWVPVVYAAAGLCLLAVLLVAGWVTSGAALAVAVLLFIGSFWMNERVAVISAPEREETIDTALAAAILDALPDPVVLLDKKREVLALNQAAAELMGDNARGSDLSMSFRHPQILDSVSMAISGGTAKATEITLSAPVRRIFEAYATSLPKGIAGNARAILVLHNVTLARQAEEMRADFVANVSHELRSPLSSLVGFIETLQGPAKDDVAAQEKFLNVMEGEAGRMARLIDDLLSLARIEVNEHVKPQGNVNVESVLDSVVDTLSVRAGERGIEIEKRIDANLPAIQGDTDQITEVFQNLIDNAIKYGQENEPISLRAIPVERIPTVGGSGVCVSVANHGVKIDPEHLPRLTERFYRIDKGRSRQMGGTGLGLAIVKHIVARHRGRLTVESTEKDGTVFSVYLPVK
ncbi:MAG: ATP-binding protein [Rhodospirillaceae bacterium]|nr:ATP-binding protein [Rhodospirillaceae bacterium]